MGFPQTHALLLITHTLLLSSFIFFSASTFTPRQPLLAQGWSPPQQNAPVKKFQEQEEKFIARALIGSSPPRCQGRCRNCERCEAVQVPVVPQQGFPRSHFMHSTAPTIAYSRGDDLSNYKPMGWRCKCGNTIYNP